MICPNCGCKNDNDAVFCNYCGVEFSQVAAAEQPIQPARGKQSSQFKKMIVGGDGEGNSAIGFWWFINIAVAVVGICILFAVANSLQEKASNAWFVDMDAVNTGINFMRGGGIVAFFIAIIGTAVMHNRISNTKIQVFEDNVTGEALSKYFTFGNVKMYTVSLSYDQITAVDAASSSIQIHASNTTYKFYVKNPTEIQNAILKQRDIVRSMQ